MMTSLVSLHYDVIIVKLHQEPPKKIFLKRFTIATQDKCSSDILSFMKSLSEKVDVLKEEVGNLTLARKLRLTAMWIPQVMNRVEKKISNPPRSRSRQTRRDRQKQKRDRRSRSRALYD